MYRADIWMGKDGCKYELNALKDGLKSLIHCSI